MRIFFFLYSLLWTIAIPFLKRKKRLRSGLEQRLVKEKYPIKNKEKILIYAASGGEALLACLFIEKNAQSNCTYYCFSWTPEGVQSFNAFASRHKEIDILAFYAPFDKPSLILKALSAIRPQKCYILETEIWFGLLRACHLLEVPITFVNARMTEKSYKNLSLFKWLLKDLAPHSVYALSEEDATRFKRLFSADKNFIEVEVRENIKFELARIALQKQENTNEKLKNSLPVPLILFASVRKEEEKILLPSINTLREKYPHVCIIVCPKHRERGVFWKENLGEHIFLASEHKINVEHWEIAFQKGYNTFVWNTFGELKKLYTLADIVFVGGSLLPKLGGQNFLEPLSVGTIPYIGKHVSNFSWVFYRKPDIRSLQLVKEVCDRDELIQRISIDIDNFKVENRMPLKEEIQSKFSHWLK